MLIEARRSPDAAVPEGFFTTRARYLQIVTVVAIMAAAAFLMRPLGFRLTMLAFYGTLLPVLGRRSLVEILILAVLGSFGVYYLFDQLLGLSLPLGPFDI